MPDEEKSSTYAEMGTRFHEYIATGKGNLNESEIEIAELCVAFRKEAFDQINAGDITETILEERYWYDDIYSGQIDRIDFIGEETAILTDYKTGRNAQSNASENLQLRAYAVLAKKNFPKLKRVFVCIVQPMAGPTTIAEYEEIDIKLATEQIFEICRKAYSPDAPRTPSPEACKYCRAKTICPEAGGKVRTLAKNSVESILALSDDQLAEYNDAADVAESVIEAIRSETRRRLNTGSSIRGFELKSGRSSRTIENADDAFAKLHFAGILDAEEFAKCCKVSVPQLEKVVAHNLKLKAKEGKDKLAELLGDIISSKTSEPIMARSK
jgi:CRISPR/Cas system-associated exonuclease Cas4 (RecB family)